jgi:hypothetical protein
MGKPPTVRDDSAWKVPLLSNARSDGGEVRIIRNLTRIHNAPPTLSIGGQIRL